MTKATHTIIKQAVRRAQQIARQSGLKLGDTVAHPDEPIACELLAINGEMALIGWQELRREVPLNELFDPNVAKQEALCIQQSTN